MNDGATRHADLGPAEARRLFRDGLGTPTAGWSRGWTQANLMVLPLDLALDFLVFAQRNPKPCPVLDVLEAGQVSGPLLAGDIRTDLPAYRVYVDGELAEETADVTSWWRDDLVSFLIGCSFTFEAALAEGCVPVHVGDPAALGITDLGRPDFGDPVELDDGDVPVFWACGVTPQAAVMESRPPLAIAHAPGHMLITDARDSDYVVP